MPSTLVKKIQKLHTKNTLLFYSSLTIITLIIIIYIINTTTNWIPNIRKWILREPFQMYKMERPFLNIYDDKNRMLNVVFITHPFTREESYQQYLKAIGEGVKFLGMSSYSEFPSYITNPHDMLKDTTLDCWTKHDYFKYTGGWCHCFKNPNKYIPPEKNVKLALISESDFAYHDVHKPDPTIKKEYDFIYVCLKDNDKCEAGWQSHNRNWDNAKLYLDIMCSKYKLRGLLIGRIGCEIPKNCHQMMELTDKLDYSEFIKQYNKCKFVFVPNTTDASPRVLTEALCFNLPALVNTDILGGWKYINSGVSGELFDHATFENTLDTFVSRLNNNQYTPRDYYKSKWGVENAGIELKKFVLECFNVKELNLDMNDVNTLKPGV